MLVSPRCQVCRRRKARRVVRISYLLSDGTESLDRTVNLCETCLRWWGAGWLTPANRTRVPLNAEELEALLTILEPSGPDVEEPAMQTCLRSRFKRSLRHLRPRQMTGERRVE